MTRKNITGFIVLLLTCLIQGTSALAAVEDRVFFAFDASNGLSDNSAQTIKCTKTGRMVITTIGHINFYDGDAFVHIDPRPEDAFPLPKYNGHYHLYFDKHHHLWLKDKFTVTCLDLMTERFIHNVGGVIRDLGMNREVEDLFADVNNHLWFLSGDKLYGTDLNVVIPVRLSDELQDVDVYDNHLLLEFFGNGTVAAYNLETGKHMFDVPALTEDGMSDYGKSSVICPEGNVYYQIRNGDKEAVLTCFDVEKREWRVLMTTPYHLNNMVVHDGKLYVASEYGYWTYNISTGETQHQETLTLTEGKQLQTDINTIAFDRQGGMWMGTEKRGILYSKYFKSPFICYTWDRPEAMRYGAMLDRVVQNAETLGRHVNCRYRDSRGWIWTGTYTGLQLQKPDEKEVRVYTRRDGLMNEMIHSVIEDNNHDVWVATSYGISHIFIRDDKVYNIESYINRDNVPNESFVNGKAMKLDDGTIVMQSLDHVVAFNPNDFHTDLLAKMTLLPKLIKVLVNGTFINAGTKVNGKVIIDRSVTRLKDMVVSYDQNTISMTFSGLNFMRPIQTYYRVRVKGVYDDWHVLSFANSSGRVDRNGLLHLPLSALKPGKYDIEVQASMSKDDWPVDPFVWTLYVKQPWWRSTGIYILLALLLLSLIIANFVFFNHNTRLRMICNREEEDIMRRIRNYAKRCFALSSEVLTPYSSEVNANDDANITLNKDFVNVMQKVVPYLFENRDKRVSMRQLSDLTGKEPGPLYDLLSANLYKSPRQIALVLRLQQAADLLLNTSMEVEDVAGQCNFVSPNFFIASFYHHYRMTPADYRNSNP